MSKILNRTSVTIDEAVAIMLDWADGPLEYRRIDGDDEDDPEALVFDIREILEEKLESLISDLAEAKHDKQPHNVIDEIQAALHRHKKTIALANTFLCAIEDELNKGERSSLRRDTKRSNDYETYITLTSLREWRKSLPHSLSTDPSPKGMAIQEVEATESESKPRRKLLDQERAILDMIRQLGHDPQALPKRQEGGRGIKVKVRDALKKAPLFTAKTSFDKAWERLRKEGSITGG